MDCLPCRRRKRDRARRGQAPETAVPLPLKDFLTYEGEDTLTPLTPPPELAGKNDNGVRPNTKAKLRFKAKNVAADLYNRVNRVRCRFQCRATPATSPELAYAKDMIASLVWEKELQSSQLRHLLEERAKLLEGVQDQRGREDALLLQVEEQSNEKTNIIRRLETLQMEREELLGMIGHYQDEREEWAQAAAGIKNVMGVQDRRMMIKEQEVEVQQLLLQEKEQELGKCQQKVQALELQITNLYAECNIFAKDYEKRLQREVDASRDKDVEIEQLKSSMAALQEELSMVQAKLAEAETAKLSQEVLMGTMPMEDEEVPMMVGAMSPAGISFSSEQHTKVFEAIPMSKGLLINSAIGLDQAPVEVGDETGACPNGIMPMTGSCNNNAWGAGWSLASTPEMAQFSNNATFGFETSASSRLGMWSNNEVPGWDEAPLSSAFGKGVATTSSLAIINNKPCGGLDVTHVLLNNAQQVASPVGQLDVMAIQPARPDLPLKHGSLGIGHGGMNQSVKAAFKEPADFAVVSLSRRVDQLLREKTVVDVIGDNSLAIQDLVPGGLNGSPGDIFAIIQNSAMRADLSLRRNLAFEGVLAYGGCAAIVTVPAYSTVVVKIVVLDREDELCVVFAEQAAMEIHTLSLLGNAGVPYVAKIIDWSVDGTNVYLVQRRYKCSLYDLGGLSEDEVKHYVAPILLYLIHTFYEDYHLCHGDIKGANILLDDQGQLVLTDFNSVQLLAYTPVCKELAGCRHATVEDEVRDLGVMLVNALTNQSHLEVRGQVEGDGWGSSDDDDEDEDDDDDDDAGEEEEEEEDPRTLLSLLPPEFSLEGRHVLEQMLSSDRQDRSPQAIMLHPWFSDIDWQAVALGQLMPPASLVQRVTALEPPSIVPLDHLLSRQQGGLCDADFDDDDDEDDYES